MMQFRNNNVPQLSTLLVGRRGAQLFSQRLVEELHFPPLGMLAGRKRLPNIQAKAD